MKNLDHAARVAAACALLGCFIGFAGAALAQQLPVVDHWLGIADQFTSSYLAEVEKEYPQYFSGLPALPR
jgi:hypothetical protein